VGYSWHWDLDHTKKTVQEYRETIIHLLTPLGFRQYPTNEPNVSLRPENLFMARIGEEVDKAVKKRFTNLLFGITDD
jgi:acetoin utilization protein AcuA